MYIVHTYINIHTYVSDNCCVYLCFQIHMFPYVCMYCYYAIIYLLLQIFYLLNILDQSSDAITYTHAL